MATNLAEEENEDEEKPVRKRRYNPKKANDEEDAPSPPQRGGREEDEDEDEYGEKGLSTGNVYLDIALDFRDDCIEWAQAHLLYAIIISSVAGLIFSTCSYFFISSWVHYLNRPSLDTVIGAYDNGYFPETKLLADHALQYISPTQPEKRTPFLFLQGAALCAIAERVAPADKRDYYLTAANYLKEAAVYNFLPNRADEGWFLFGKSLYHCGELEQCREPLRCALEEGYPYTKKVNWYLANAYFLGAPPDLRRSRQYLHSYQNEPTILEEEIAESLFLETMIALHTESIDAATEVFAKIPRFEQFALQRHFVEGQIELFKARELMRQAIDLEMDPNPRSLRNLPVVPVPVEPESVPPRAPAIPGIPSDEIPTAPVPVRPIDEATFRELMLPHNSHAPVLGTFDSTSEIQQRIATMRARYAKDAAEDEIVVLSREDAKPVPMPTLQPQEQVFDPLDDNPALKRAREFREAAAYHYQRAIDRFVEVTRRVMDPDNPWGREARLLAGICAIENGEPKAAHSFLHNLIEAFPMSSEAVAAGFLLGERERTLENTDAAFRMFAQSLENMRHNPNYTSLWLPKAVIMEKYVTMVRSDIEKQHYTDVQKLLDMLNGVMEPAVRVRLIGETYESWGTLLQSQAETTFGERGNQLAKDAESKWRGAGSAFARLAQILSETQEFTTLLWRGAENYWRGKDYRNAILEYLKFSKANLVEHRPEVNFRLGELYLHLDHLNEAKYVLEEALSDYPSHALVPQIRLLLSHVCYEQNDLGKARSLLQLNLVSEAAPNSGPYRDSMYELGKICFIQGDVENAIPFLEDAVKVHPGAIQAADAYYTLAQAYLKRAEDSLGELAGNPPEVVRRSVDSLVQTNRRRALLYLDRVDHILSDRQRAIGLTESENLMLRNAHFMTCSLLLKMEQYEQVIPRLNSVATMYQNREEALDALTKMAYAMRMIGMKAESQTTLRRAEVILNQLKASGTVNESGGTNWQNVIQKQMR